MPASAKKATPASEKAKPEALKKTPKATVEDVTDEEDDFARKPSKTERKLYEPRPNKGVRFKEAEVGGSAPRRDRPYVEVPPLPSSYKTGPPRNATKARPSNHLPNVERKAPVYKRQAPIEEAEVTKRVMEELMNAKFTTSLRDLASVSPAARDYLKKMITRRKVAVEEPQSDLEYNIIALVDLMTTEQQERTLEACNLLEKYEENKENEEPEEMYGGFLQVEELPTAQVFLSQGYEDIPDGSWIISDPVEQYLNSLEEGEDPRPIAVARESMALRTVYPEINRSSVAEVLLDTGSQICSMDVDIARQLGLTWDPDVIIHLQSANRTTEKTLGLARNVPFDFGGGVTAYIQLHIIRRPAYDVLLGRPFDVTMSTEVLNQANGEQVITLRDPNTGKKITLSTYPRGKPPPGVAKVLQDQKERNFRASRI